MTDTTANAVTQGSGPGGRVVSQDVTVMDLWLVISSYRRFAATMIVLSVAMGVALAVVLTPVHNYTTAIEIGNQVQNDEILPIEAPTTVSDKLLTGYIPLITNQFVQQNPDGPEEYVIEVRGSENSQIVQLLSEAPADQSALISDLHNQVVQTLVEDHNRTVDAMRANAEILLSEAEQKLGEMVAQQRALTIHLSSLATLWFQLMTMRPNSKTVLPMPRVRLKHYRRAAETVVTGQLKFSCCPIRLVFGAKYW